MLWGHHTGSLELRRANDGSATLVGSFPYDRNAVLSDGGRGGGRPRKERIKSGAFKYRIETPSEHGGPKEITLLLGHDWNHPLASVRAGTLKLKDTPKAVLLEATITRAIAETSYGRDALAMIGAGLATGLSPGFRLPPPRAVAKAEEIEEEPDDGSIDEDGQPRRGAIIRIVLAALLYEFSLVTRPAYPEAQVEARNWVAGKPGYGGLRENPPSDATLRRALNRWRA